MNNGLTVFKSWNIYVSLSSSAVLGSVTPFKRKIKHFRTSKASGTDFRMAITYDQGVILGADSRTTTGAYIANRVTDKLTRVHDTIWCCRSGSAADTQAIADIVQYHLELYGVQHEEGPTTETAAALFQELCYSNKDQLRWVMAWSQMLNH